MSEESEEIQNPELAKLAQSIQPSEVEKALQAPEGGEEAAEEEQEQVYPFLGKFIDSILRIIAKRRGMTDEDIERYIALNEIEMDSANEALSPILRRVFEKLGLAPDEIYALLTFLMLIGPRAVIIATYKPEKPKEKKEEGKNDQSGSPNQ
ncbi:MAG: hypothetical protein RXR82_06300 [Nitrososphaeria archaeon]